MCTTIMIGDLGRNSGLNAGRSQHAPSSPLQGASRTKRIRSKDSPQKLSPLCTTLGGIKIHACPKCMVQGKSTHQPLKKCSKSIFKKKEGGRRRAITMALASSSWNSIDRCHTRQLAGHCCPAELVQEGKSQEGQN